jgi:hypothetical protein
MAMLVGLIALGPADGEVKASTGTIMMSTFTDSQVSAHAVARGASTSFPLCLVAMELAAQAEARGVKLLAEWAPREVNSEADALTNEMYEGFDANLRVNLDPSRLPLLVLPELMAEAACFYTLVQEKRRLAVTAAQPGAKRRRASRPLRESAPW